MDKAFLMFFLNLFMEPLKCPKIKFEVKKLESESTFENMFIKAMVQWIWKYVY